MTDWDSLPPVSGRTVARRVDPDAGADGDHAERPDHAHVLGLQRAAGNAATASLIQRDAADLVQDTVNGGGQPLPDATKAKMEAGLGADLSDVRVHTGSAATESAQAVGAHAYTVGSHVAFQDGQYAPGTSDGDRVLAHELSHVVQQRNGPVDGTEGPDGLKISDPSDRFERAADANAEAISSGSTSTHGEHGAAGVQRQAAEPGEELQTLPVQRAEKEGDELQEEEPLQRLAVQRQDDEEMEGEEEQKQ
jgi:hypothetical protein